MDCYSEVVKVGYHIIGAGKNDLGNVPYMFRCLLREISTDLIDLMVL